MPMSPSPRTDLSPRLVPAALAVLLLLLGMPALAQPEGAQPAPRGEVQVAEVTRAQRQLWDSFNHYTLIARHDLAAAAGQALLGEVDQQQLLTIQEDASQRYDERPLQIALRSQEESLQEVAREIERRIQAARIERSRDPQRIMRDIDLLAQGRRPNAEATRRLQVAGQYAAPLLLETLIDPNRENLHPYVINAMIAVGRDIVYPLCIALPDLEPTAMSHLARVLAEVGYPQALPYLKEVMENPRTDPDVRRVVDAAYRRILAGTAAATDADAATLYLTLGEAEYLTGTRGDALLGYDATIQKGLVWYYGRQSGLVPLEVPASIHPDVMAMRSAHRALRLNPDLSDALSLFIMANLRRENNLPAGEADPTYGSEMRPPMFYAMMAGPHRLHDVLDRALGDGDGPLALDAIEALSRTAGTSALVAEDAARQPLLAALSYPDRRVRFRAALALANARPGEVFDGAYRVVPVLAEALRQSDVRYALVLADDQDVLNRSLSALSDLGFNAFGGRQLNQVIDQLDLAPGIDLLVINKDLAGVLNERQNAMRNYKLANVPILAMVSSVNQAQLRQLERDDPLFSTVIASAEEPQLVQSIELATASFAGEPIPADESLDIALDALDALRDVALATGGVYNVLDALSALIAGVTDPRQEVAAASAHVLAMVNESDAQQAIIEAALQTAGNLQISLLQSLAESATHYGNLLTQAQTDALLELVMQSQGDLSVAAAEAHGALTLPTANAVRLLTEHKE